MNNNDANNYDTLIIIILTLSCLILINHIKEMNENYRLSDDLVDKYYKEKEDSLLKKYSLKAWNHCSDLMKLILKWSEDENEVVTIENKEFPCGNTMIKCLEMTTKQINNNEDIGQPINLSEFLQK